MIFLGLNGGSQLKSKNFSQARNKLYFITTINIITLMLRVYYFYSKTNDEMLNFNILLLIV